MTAIAGILRHDGFADAAMVCERMLTVQAMYGPHDQSQWSDGDVSLGRRLYRVLPEDLFDRQPVESPSGRVLVADVRLDNRAELASALDISPGLASEMADSALLSAAWDKWEDRCGDHLLGDYAFAVWDKRRRRLVLMRDPLGERPLHYHQAGGFIAFASMAKGLHSLEEVPREPDEGFAAAFAALLIDQGADTFFKGVQRVEPGCMVIAQGGSIRSSRWWNPSRRTLRLKSTDDYVEALRAQLDEAVRQRFRRLEGAVGSHLSSGWDSSAVSATAARVLPPRDRLQAFTAAPRLGYDGPPRPRRIGDESILAAVTAAQYPNIEHITVRATKRSPVEDFDRDFYLFETPMMNPCNGVWERDIFQAAKQRGVSVLLTGSRGNGSITYDGSDGFGELVAQGRWGAWLREARAAARNSPMRWRGILLASFGHWTPPALWNLLYRLKDGAGQGVSDYSAVHPRWLESETVMDRAKSAGIDIHGRPSIDPFARRLLTMQSSDCGSYNKGVLAGWGVDQRDPTGDRRLVEFCLSLPRSEIMADGRPRALARRVLADRVPAAVLEQPFRGYQAIDWHEGLTENRDAIAYELDRIAASDMACRALDVARMRRLMEDMPTSGWHETRVMSQYRLVLLRGLAVGHFLRKASGSNG